MRRKPKFKVGQRVATKTDPVRFGTIRVVEANKTWAGGYRYSLVKDGPKTKTWGYAATMLRKVREKGPTTK